MISAGVIHFANPDLFNFTFRNDGAPYDETGYRGETYGVQSNPRADAGRLLFPIKKLPAGIFTQEIPVRLSALLTDVVPRARATREMFIQVATTSDAPRATKSGI